MNWDLWLGPRETRPYSPDYNPVAWRDFWDFGTAPIGDFSATILIRPSWALDLREPLRIEASAVGGVDSYIAPFGGTLHLPFRSAGQDAAG